MSNGNKPFGNLSTEGLETPKDSLGGGSRIFESGIYEEGEIKAFYAGKSDGGAHNVTVIVDFGGQEYKETIYVTNKKGENFYLDKDKKKQPLPGFVTINDIAMMATGYDLASQDWEERTVKIYDFNAKADVATVVQSAVNVVGSKITLAILKVVEPKQKKNDAGVYVNDPAGGTRESNSIDKVFHADSRRTFSEVTRKLEKGEFIDAWAAKNTGKTRDKTGGAAGKAGAPGAAAAADGAAPTKGKSLFS